MRRAPMERVSTSSKRPTSGPTMGKSRVRARSSISRRTGSPSSYFWRRYSSMRGSTMGMRAMLGPRIAQVEQEAGQEVRARAQHEMGEEEDGRPHPPPEELRALLQVHEEDDDQAGL